MKNITPRLISELCRGNLYGNEEYADRDISNIVIDNRQVEKDGMFIAHKGENTDSNKYIPDAYKSGALCCMSEREPKYDIDRGIYIKTDNCFDSLRIIAEYYRKQLKAKVIGITGSVGKTSTKEMLFSVLNTHYKTSKTQGNFNNEIGMPLTLTQIKDDDEMAVVEMGINHFGEMTRLSKIAKPDMCVITNIGECHLEYLNDRDGVLKAKTEIFKHMKKGGDVVLNGDDDKLVTIKEVHGRKPVFFGFGKHNDVRVISCESMGLSGTKVKVSAFGEEFDLDIHAPGRHMVTNALAAVAVGMMNGLSHDEIYEGVKSFEPLKGHGSIFKTGKFTCLDDCYNANPVALMSGIDVLSEVPDRKVAVIGDMLELGSEVRELHRKVGRYIAEKKIDVLIAVGNFASEYVSGVNDIGYDGEIYHFNDTVEAADELKNILRPKDAILVKASHGMHLESLVDKIKEM